MYHKLFISLVGNTHILSGRFPFIIVDYIGFCFVAVASTTVQMFWSGAAVETTQTLERTKCPIARVNQEAKSSVDGIPPIDYVLCLTLVKPEQWP